MFYWQLQPNAKGRLLAQAPSHDGHRVPQELHLELRGLCRPEKGFLAPIRLHVCPFSLLASDLVIGLKSLFFPSYSKLEEDRRQHKTTRAPGEIPRLRAK